VTAPDPALPGPPLRLHDTRRGRIEEFTAAHTVRMYVCGITPYDAGHLGHAFTYSAFDVLERLLRARGHRVRHCRNVTDVDDDIVRTAAERDISVAELAAREIAVFEREMASLGIRRPGLEPRATEVIDPIITAVHGLVRRGHAYTLFDGRVYLDVTSVEVPVFGSLVGLSDEQRLERFADNGGDPQASGKRSPLDVLLWQPPSGTSGEPTWASPWGPGRPGWHIECSVMAMEELGSTIDVHGGGSDLRFPHHEIEILQSELLTQQAPFARFWLHTGMAGLDGQKMSKSQGNLVGVGELLEGHPGGAVRRYLLSHHYRNDWSFDPRGLAAADEGFRTWTRAAFEPGRDRGLEDSFHAALADDLDTPSAIEVLDELAATGAGESLIELLPLIGVRPSSDGG